MKPLQIIGIILIVAGILGFIFGAITYEETETVAEIGDVDITNTDEESIVISPYASGGAVIAGLVLVVAGAASSRK